MEKVLKKYIIRIQGLSDKEHEYDFEVDDSFFEAFEQDIVEKGQLTAHVDMIKSPTMIRLNYTIDGVVRLTCDRSLDEFDYPIHLTESYLYKFGAGYQEIADDAEVIPSGTAEINIARHLFDYIALAVPMKRLHPRYADDDEAMAYSTDSDNEEAAESSPTELPDAAPEIDPRWAALEALKNQTKNSN